ncbi:MAG TPA: cation diffusion facilitator family transporter [Leptolyngbyaceae cyanobacterium]
MHGHHHSSSHDHSHGHSGHGSHSHDSHEHSGHGHGHGGHHHGGHHHSHAPKDFNRAFILGIALNVGFVAVEVIIGLLTQSLALLADALHNLSDVLGLLLAWGANHLSKQPPSQRYTYGLRRTSILAALVNAVLLLLAMGAIAWEALRRLQDPGLIDGSALIWVAGIGVVVNGLTAWLFMSGRDRDLNIRGAFLHMAADALVSLGVVLTGIAILATGWAWFDPIISLVIVVIVTAGTWQLLKDSLNLVMDAVPPRIEPAAVQLLLKERPGVTALHDLHIWAMSTTEIALTVHLVMPEGHPGDAFLCQVCQELHQHFGIDHATIQVELGDTGEPCALEPEHLI